MTEVVAPAGDRWAERAGAVLRSGGLVAFPTETVYGLGAHALDVAAVARVFTTKGRPSTDPLIVHVTDTGSARALSTAWPATADALAARFWPGPLTLVVPRSPLVPPEVTAGGDTVAVRVPAHPVALELLAAAGVPVAAPSANRFGRLSPTTARHVVDELGDGVDVVVDGGATPLGIESTVVRVGPSWVEVLRPGGVTAEDLATVVGEVRVADRRTVAPGAAAASPGQLLAHYAPGTPLVLVEGGPSVVEGLAAALTDAGERAGVVDLPADGDSAAPLLYARLRAADERGDSMLLVAVVSPDGLGRAVNDRLFRAAHGRVATDARPTTVARLLAARPGR